MVSKNTGKTLFDDDTSQNKILQKRNFNVKDWDNGKDEWLTPPELVNVLGIFDLDPCAPINRPWPTAKEHFTILDDGLSKDWHGRVWCNPPYSEWNRWAARCAAHENSTLLIYARTETIAFQNIIFKKSNAILFIKGKLTFYHVNGFKGKHSSSAGSVLVSFNEENTQAIVDSKIKGHLTRLNVRTAY